MKNIFYSCIFLVIFGNIFSQEYFYNDEFHINTFSEGSQFLPTMGGLNDGGFAVAWTSDLNDGNEAGISMQIYERTGIKNGNELKVNSNSSVVQIEPKISGLTNGNFVVCWTNIPVVGGKPEVYAQIFDKNGIRVTNEFMVNDSSTTDQFGPAVAGLKNGGFVICWKGLNIQGNVDQVFAKRFENNGQIIGNEFRVNTSSNNNIWNCSISALNNDGFIIAWDSKNPNENDENIFAQMYDNNGLKVGNEFLVNTYTNNDQGMPSISKLTNGGFIICWQSWEQDGSRTGIYAQIYDDRALKVGVEFRVNTFTIGDQVSPTVSRLSNDNFIICWNSQGEDDQYGRVYAQLFDQFGIKVGREFKVSSTESSYQGIASVIGLLNNEFVICWENKDDIYGRHFFGEPDNYNLINFELIDPLLDSTLNVNNPLFIWSRASKNRFSYPWDFTYDLYIDNNPNFTNSFIKLSIEDTLYKVDKLANGQTYFWTVLARNFYGDSLWSSNVNGFYINPNALTDFDDDSRVVPEKFSLFQNYPNPFNPTTTINYSIPVVDAKFASTTNQVTLIVYDVLGREIKTLVNEVKNPGNYEVTFDATNLPSGVYYYQLKTGDFMQTKKMLYLK